MEENILICEDCMEGIFTAVYTAYEKHYLPEHTRIQTSEEENMRLFAVYETVKTNRMKSEKVIRTLKKRFGEEAFLYFCYVLSSEDERKATALYRTIAKGLRLSVPASVLERGAEEEVGIVHRLKENVWREIHHFYGFLRFRELENGVLFAEIRPKNNILEFLAAHFADRFPREHFLIHDTGRRWFAVHEAGKEWFLADGEHLQKEELAESREEKESQELFRHFCHNITIKERRNIGLQKSLLPLRFRPYMTEFQKSGSKEQLSV